MGFVSIVQQSPKEGQSAYNDQYLEWKTAKWSVIVIAVALLSLSLFVKSYVGGGCGFHVVLSVGGRRRHQRSELDTCLSHGRHKNEKWQKHCECSRLDPIYGAMEGRSVVQPNAASQNISLHIKFFVCQEARPKPLVTLATGRIRVEECSTNTTLLISSMLRSNFVYYKLPMGLS